jgi:fatty acid desaturase
MCVKDSSTSGMRVTHPSPDAVPHHDKAARQPRPVMSSGVPFYPPSDRLWRIGGKWYDFEPFLKLHPGGAEVVRLARDRYEDATYAFESHHHNYTHARKVIAKYEVAAPSPEQLKPRPAGALVPGAGGEGGVGKLPSLCDDDAFYSVVRRRLTDHLRKVKCPRGEPTRFCCQLFWVNFVAFCASWAVMFATGTFVSSVVFGLLAALLGAFGHNWVHQPAYRVWSYLSLDTIGFSSTGWFREHVLQHHMYTNTPWDNHFHGTDPFLITDPTVTRNWVQRTIMPYANPFILTFGLYANFLAHFADMLMGHEEWRPTKAILPVNIGLMLWRWGLVRGGLLTYTWGAVLGLWYFTMALMNHNAEHTQNVERRNKARDWGEMQLVSSADWGVQLPFEHAWIYLWLNYHTVHHLFPRLDFSHHHAAQSILMQTCAEMGVEYVAADSPWKIYKEMVHSFATPRSLQKAVMVYGGGL